MFPGMFANGANKKRPLDIQKQTVKRKAEPPRHIKVDQTRSTQARKIIAKPAKKTHESSARISNSSNSLVARGGNRRSNTPFASQSPINFGQEDSDDDESPPDTPKRLKLDDDQDRDVSRLVRVRDAFDPQCTTKISMVHAADIPTLDKGTKYEPAFPGLPESFRLELQYPSMASAEKYSLTKPIHDPHAFQAVSDITEVMHQVAENYLPEKARNDFVNESTGFPQRFQRAINKREVDVIKQVIEEYNTALAGLRDDGSIAGELDKRHSLHPSLIERILNQTYSRTVSPNLKVLSKYQAGTDNVYGELLPKFVSGILRKDLRMKSSDVFVDLGSGVGNVVLQTALEVGCESWGCEMMKEYYRVADLQHAEFLARCRLWGLAIGKIFLEKGNFLENVAIRKALRKADTVLVNNQVFTPELNEALTNLFLDLKDGCRVVSLKSFVPSDHKITSRNLNSSYNVLSVEKKRYYSNCVSWTNEGGTYYVSTKDSKRIERFLQKHP